METNEKPRSWMHDRAEQIEGANKLVEGSGKLIKSSGILIAAIIGAVGVILLAIWEFPKFPVPVSTQPIETLRPKDDIIKTEEKVSEAQQALTPANEVLHVAGTWRDDEGNPVNFQQEGATIQVTMSSISDSGIPMEFAGSGNMVNRSVHIELDCQTLGQSLGRIPMDITFHDTDKAFLTMNLAGVPISGNLYR